MKWQGFDNTTSAGDKVNKMVVSLKHSRSMLVIAAVTALIIVATASFKWGGF